MLSLSVTTGYAIKALMCLESGDCVPRHTQAHGAGGGGQLRLRSDQEATRCRIAPPVAWDCS